MCCLDGVQSTWSGSILRYLRILRVDFSVSSMVNILQINSVKRKITLRPDSQKQVIVVGCLQTSLARLATTVQEDIPEFDMFCFVSYRGLILF